MFVRFKRYKESISKGTRSLKERLLARNNSVKELSKEVQREMSAGIAGVAKMIERLDLASKRTGTSIPASGNTVGTSSVLFKGKSVQESAINKKSMELACDLISDAPSHVSSTNSGQMEVSQQVRKLSLECSSFYSHFHYFLLFNTALENTVNAVSVIRAPALWNRLF